MILGLKAIPGYRTLQFLLLVTVLIFCTSRCAMADTEAKLINYGTVVQVVVNYIDTRETRYFLVHGPFLCNQVILSYDGKFPPGTICTAGEKDILAKPFVGNNATAYASMVGFTVLSNGIVRALDSIKWMHKHHVMSTFLLGADGVEIVNDIHNASIVRAQINFAMKTP